MVHPRLLVLHNDAVLPVNHPDAASEREILETIEIVSHVLRAEGFRVSRLALGNDLAALLDGLKKFRPQAVFNLFEGLADPPFTETVVAGVLSMVCFSPSPLFFGTPAPRPPQHPPPQLLAGA